MRTLICTVFSCLVLFPFQLRAEDITEGQYKKSYEDAIVQVKSLRHQLYKADQRLLVDNQWYQIIQEEISQLRTDNSVLKKNLQAARDYLESKGIYISDLTGRVYDYTKSPLYREKIARQIVDEKLRLEKNEHDFHNQVYERKIAELNRDYYLLNQECLKYKNQVEEDKRYFGALQQQGIVK